MTVKLWSSELPEVRSRLLDILNSLGYELEGSVGRPPLRLTKGHRTIVVRFQQALLKNAVTVAATFAPPAPSGTAKRILDTLQEAFPVARVSMTEADIMGRDRRKE